MKTDVQTSPLLIGFFLVLLQNTAYAETTQAGKLTFIVNRDNPVTTLTVEQISAYYLKKQTRFPNGTPVRFIDWKADAIAHLSFLSQVVGKTNREIELYWIAQKVYTGYSAPLRASSEEMIVRFVSKFKGAIGYITSPGGIDSEGVKTVEVVRSK